MQIISNIVSRLGSFWLALKTRSAVLWTRYRGLTPWKQWAIAIAAVVALFFLLSLGGGEPAATQNQLRTVELKSIGSLSGTGDGRTIIGTVRSVTEADLMAQTGGTVRAVNTRVGAYVAAGTVIASLDNASEAAQVTQAEGAYEAALAARAITSIQAGSAETSLEEAEASARNTYRSAFTTVDVEMDTVDMFFSGPYFAPSLNTGTAGGNLNERMAEVNERMRSWRYDLDSADTANPEALLNQAYADVQFISVFLTDLARSVNSDNSSATADQRAALASTRATINGLVSSLSAARDSFNAKKSAAAVAATQSHSSASGTASADASVKSALGSLQAAKANFERTVVRAPISGTVNFLPIRVGDYVTAFTHVATVAQNGALEIVAYVSEDDRALISAGDTVQVEGNLEGIVTSIAPALDPVTKQIEVRVAVEAAADGADALVNGQSVRITLSGAAPEVTEVSGPIYLPLTSVKLRGDERLIFTIGEDGRLKANPVEIGEVMGDRILVETALDPALRVVVDARGLAEGQQVNVAD